MPNQASFTGRLPVALAVPVFAALLAACSGESSNNATPPAAIPGPSTNPPVDDRTPVGTAAATGNNQSAVTGTNVPVRPAVRVTDRAGRGVANMTVIFEVVTGGGSVTGANQMTNADGVATVGGWTLGPAGPQQLNARTLGLPVVTFAATSMAPQGTAQLEAVANSNDQSANIGLPVAVAPAVLVRNPSGSPQAGVTVTFAVASGSGSVQNGTATSGSNGIASAGAWTLGTTAGAQTLTASATGYPSVTFRATATPATEPSLTRTVFLGGRSNLWDLAFTPDNALLFTERTQGLAVRRADSQVFRLFGTAGSALVATDFRAEDQSGMLGVAVDPDFATNRYVYVYMASTTPSPTLQQGTNNRVVRLTVNADYTGVSNRTDIVTGISYAGGAHSGGRIKFGPDGFLYITTGDNRIGEIPQSLAVLGSKVLRVDRNGVAAPGNNTPAGGDARIYTFGHRNVQGIDFRPTGFANAGRAYTGEHGPGHDDEVTPLTAGGNAGWDPLCRPEMTGYCGYSRPTSMTDLARFPNAMRPLWQTGGFEGRTGRSEGMGDVAFLRGPQWRSWDGALAVALMAGMRMEVLRIDAAGTTITGRSSAFTNLSPRQRVRALELGPDGALYVSCDCGEIWRVTAQ
jgi:glucose/arabinose dehydrogenase